MDYKIVITPDAFTDIENAINYYKLNASKRVATLFINDYKKAFKDILKTK